MLMTVTIQTFMRDWPLSQAPSFYDNKTLKAKKFLVSESGILRFIYVGTSKDLQIGRNLRSLQLFRLKLQFLTCLTN